MNDFNSESLSLNGKPAFYAAVYSDLREIAYKYGWALGLHGSLANDMDIMAMPWTKDASSIDILIRELQAKFDGPFKGVDVKPYRGKPNGRVVYSIPIWGDLYLDINVIEKEE